MMDPETLAKLAPVAGIRIWPGGHVEVVRVALCKMGSGTTGNVSRGTITHLSRKSLSRLTMTAKTGAEGMKSMLTLTYGAAPPHSGKKAKSDLNWALNRLRRMTGGGLRYIWFAEFQGRGAIHFHILLSLDKPDRGAERGFWRAWADRVALDDDDARRIMWVHVDRPDARGWEKIRDDDGAARYITTYASKPHQKSVPKHFQNMGRFWGASRGLVPSPRAEIKLSEQTLRRVLAQEGHRVAGWDVVPRYLFDVEAFGNIDESVRSVTDG